METHIAIVCFGPIGTKTMKHLQQDSQLQQRDPNLLRLSWKNLTHIEAQDTTDHTINRADMVLIIGDNTAGKPASSALHSAVLCSAKCIPCYALLALPTDSTEQSFENILLQQTVSSTLIIPLTGNDKALASSAVECHLADAALNVLRPLGSNWLFNIDAAEIHHLLKIGVDSSFSKATSSSNNASEATVAALQLLPELNKAHYLLCNLNIHQDLPLEQLVQVNNLLREHSHENCQIMQSCSLHNQTDNNHLEISITAMWRKQYSD